MKSNVDTREVSIPVSDKDRTSGILSIPAKAPKNTSIILAHGAANDMTNPLMAAFANGLARSGYPVLRFNFVYAEHKRKVPDKEPLLVAAWDAAYRFLMVDSGVAPGAIVAAGKSLGGRIASQMVANGQLHVKRLIFLGYPLHRTGDPSNLRDSHLYNITIPMLFIAGTRDTLCEMSALTGVLSRLRVPHELFTIEGGDHSFHVPKSAGFSDDEVYERIVIKAIEWLARESSE